MAKPNSTAITPLAAKRFKYDPQSGKKPSFLADAPPYSGLRLLAYESGNKTWVYRYRNKITGQLKQIKIGSFSESDLGLKKAREYFNSYKAERDAGGCPATRLKEEKLEAREQLKLAKKKPYTVADMMEHYITEHVEQKRSIKGYTEINRLSNKDIIPHIGKIKATELSRANVHDLIQLIAKRAPVIACDVRRELRAAFEHGISAGRIPEHSNNPTTGVKAPQRNQGKRILLDDEITLFLEWLPTATISQNVKDALLLSLFTGCRTGEIVKADWKSIDLKKGTYHLKDTKTGLSRTVQLSNQAIYLLNSRKNDSKYVFPSNRGTKHIKQHAIVCALSQPKADGIKPRDSLKIDDWSAHDLRRTTRSGLSRLRCPSNIAEAVLGHSKKGVEGTYDLHQYEDECKEWLQTWCDHLSSLASKE
ncbi:tyrosine-type recombinase/integrase [Thalassotalea eurytherma]|uniref:Integrase n=1 Tax=Thalassotalea eurytherma TaxID=1144278 RepID=A0ABQ6H5N7_9GAMM|nr:site-specific integrase [Thalassotalea eurytherma]GLX82475.1 integrase [Thalassotalea eurytherma]